MNFSWKKFIIVQVHFVLLFLFVQPALAETEERYTKFNVHTQSKTGSTANASYANYTNPGVGHVIVPAGTQIVIIKKSRKKFVFTYDDGGKKVTFEYHQPRMGMSLDEYLDKITSLEPTSSAGLSPLDRKGVAAGKALVGMSREGVMTALGYPAAHRTPSLDMPTWVYWVNRFKTLAVEFDDRGKVVNVR